jgi:hypothetical protein
MVVLVRRSGGQRGGGASIGHLLVPAAELDGGVYEFSSVSLRRLQLLLMESSRPTVNGDSEENRHRRYIWATC